MSQTQLDREIQLEDGTTANCGLCLKENAIYMFVLGSNRFYLGEKFDKVNQGKLNKAVKEINAKNRKQLYVYMKTF